MVGGGESSRHLTGDNSSLETDWPRDAEDILADKEAEVAKLNTELNERSCTIAAQRVELVALKLQIEALTRQFSDPGTHRVQVQADVARRRGVLRLAGGQRAALMHHRS